MALNWKTGLSALLGGVGTIVGGPAGTGLGTALGGLLGKQFDGKETTLTGPNNDALKNTGMNAVGPTQNAGTEGLNNMSKEDMLKMLMKVMGTQNG